MKIIEKKIYPFQENDYFTPIRDKIAYAKVILKSARSLLLANDSSNMIANSKFKLKIDKVSRLFFYKDQKYFSVSFPFNVVIEKNEVKEITSYSGKLVDFQSISAVTSILENEQFKRNPTLIDYSIEPNDLEYLGIYLLEEIFLHEPSYIRYDYDPINENGKIHPLHHLDINYSSYSSYKIGLNSHISTDYFENIHDSKTDCLFLLS